jgi:NADH-quinone oxidoreductase subunit M
MSALLIVAFVLPLAVAVLLLVFRGTTVRCSARWIALGAAVATLLVSMALVHEYRALPKPASLPAVAGEPSSLSATPVRPRFELRVPWYTIGTAAGRNAESLSLEFHLGLDGVSLALIVLTAVLTVSCVLSSWESIRERETEFYVCLLVLESALIGAFCAFDLVLFYVFFEFTLIPLFFLIGVWGGPQRRYAAIKFFLFTLTGSLVTLVGLVALVVAAWTSGLTKPCSIPALSGWLLQHPLDRGLEIAIFLALSLGFMVKVPVFPLHTWLPLAHVEAPTAGSVLLAGALLKLGTYGFLRLCLPLFPDACRTVGLPLLGTLGVVGIVYGSLAALGQRDIKRLVAYSSVAHLGFCVLGLFALNSEGLSGAVLQMVNHGLSTGALFLLVGMIYDRYHTRMLDDLQGLAARLPLIACATVFISMASIGLPGLNGFVGEVLSLAGMFKRHPLFAVLGTAGVVLGAWYLLTMIQQAFFGPLKEPHTGGETITDMKPREMLALAPICALCLCIGIRPQPLIDVIEPDVEAVAALYGAGPSRPEAAHGAAPARRAISIVWDEK